MTKTFLLAVGICLSAIPAMGQTVTVRSGDHDAFTRFTFELNGAPVPKIEQQEDRISIEFKSPDILFDTSAAFVRISRSRVVAISQSGQLLNLTLNCICTFKTFSTPDAALFVVDVFEEISDQGNLQDSKTQDSLNGFRLPLQLTDTPNEIQSLMGPANPSATTFATSLEQAGISFQSQPIFSAKSANNTSKPGFPNLRTSNTSGANTHLSQFMNLQVSIPETYANDKSSGTQNGVHSANPDQHRKANPNHRRKPDLTCSIDQHTDIARWASSQNFLEAREQINHRRFLSSEDGFDDEYLQLFKYYVRFGLLTEARKMQSRLLGNTDEVQIPISILDIVEGQTATSSVHLAKGRECSVQSKLWFILSGNDLSILIREEVRQVRLAFLELPKELQSLLRPRAKSILFNADESMGQLNTVRNNNSIGGDLTVDVPVHMQNLFSGAVEHNRKGLSPFELANEIQVAWRTEEKPRLEDVNALRFYSVELRNSGMKPVIDKSLFRAMLLIGEYEEAFDFAQKFSLNNKTSVQAKNFLKDFFLYLTVRGSDSEFAKFIFRREALEARRDSENLDKNVAVRLMSLGW